MSGLKPKVTSEDFSKIFSFNLSQYFDSPCEGVTVFVFGVNVISNIKKDFN